MHDLIDRLAGQGSPWASLTAGLLATVLAQLAFLARRLRPGGALGLPLTLCVLAFASSAWAFGELLESLADGEAALVDQPVQAFLVAHREAWLTLPMRVVTDLGSSALLIPLAVGAGLLLRRRARTWRPLILLVSAYAGALVLQRTIKLLTHRPRPPAGLALDVFGGSAFPSGHATDAAAVYGMLAVLLTATLPRWRGKLAVWAAAVGVVALVGVSRIYLGGHWLTDVLAGFSLGTAWLLGLLIVTRILDGLGRAPTGSRPATPAPAPSRGREPAG